MSQSRVRIGSARDAAEAALIRSVLTAHDIPVHISGEHHAALTGLGASAIDQVVWVAPDDAEEASALLRELREGGEGALVDDEVPADDLAERADEVAPSGALVASGEDTLTRLGKQKRMALAVMLGMTLSHGTAHFSTRAWKRGIACAAVQITGWRYLAASQNKVAAVLLVGAMAADVIGALWEIARGPRPITQATASIRKS